MFLDITGLPEPVQLALKVIKLEGVVQEKDTKLRSLEEEISNQKITIEKINRDHDFDLIKHIKEIKFLNDKIDSRSKLEQNTKEVKAKLGPRDEKASAVNQHEIDHLILDLQKTSEDRDQVISEEVYVILWSLDYWLSNFAVLFRTLDLPDGVLSNHPCDLCVCVSVFKYLRDCSLVFSETLHVNKVKEVTRLEF